MYIHREYTHDCKCTGRTLYLVQCKTMSNLNSIICKHFCPPKITTADRPISSPRHDVSTRRIADVTSAFDVGRVVRRSVAVASTRARQGWPECGCGLDFLSCFARPFIPFTFFSPLLHTEFLVTTWSFPYFSVCLAVLAHFWTF